MGEVNNTQQGSIATANKVKVSVTDTTVGYLQDTLLAGNNVTVTKQNSGDNETLAIDLSTTDVKVKAQAGDTSNDYLINKLTTAVPPATHADLVLTKQSAGANEYLSLSMSPSLSARMPLDANDIAAWYLEDAAGSTTAYNSVTLTSDMTYQSTTNTYQGLSGLFGPAPTWPMLNAYSVVYSADAAFRPSNSISISAWVNLGGFSYYGGSTEVPNGTYKWSAFGAYEAATPSSNWKVNLCYFPGSGTDLTAILTYGTKQRVVMSYPILRFPLSGWMHLALTYDQPAGNVYWYLNGIQIGTGSAGGSLIDWANVNSAWEINGIRNLAQSRGGSVCDVRIANIARSQAHWRDVYMRGTRLGSKHYLFDLTAL